MFAFLTPGSLIVGLLCLGVVGGGVAIAVLLIVRATQKNNDTTNPNLRPCPDCGRTVSISAQSCPGCGRPLAKAN